MLSQFPPDSAMCDRLHHSRREHHCEDMVDLGVVGHVLPECWHRASKRALVKGPALRFGSAATHALTNALTFAVQILLRTDLTTAPRIFIWHSHVHRTRSACVPYQLTVLYKVADLSHTFRPRYRYTCTSSPLSGRSTAIATTHTHTRSQSIVAAYFAILRSDFDWKPCGVGCHTWRHLPVALSKALMAP